MKGAQASISSAIDHRSYLMGQVCGIREELDTRGLTSNTCENY